MTTQVTTARDMALLALALIKDYPQYYPLFNQRKVTIGKRSRGTVNALLGSYKGADGFKTGFTCGSGYNLVASATRDGRRVIGVVLGSTSRDQRASQMTMLLDAGFARVATKDVALTEAVLAEADAGAPPTVIAGGTCATHGDGESAVMAAARAGAWGIAFGSFADKKKAEAVLADARRQLGPLAGAKADDCSEELQRRQAMDGHDRRHQPGRRRQGVQEAMGEERLLSGAASGSARQQGDGVALSCRRGTPETECAPGPAAEAACERPLDQGPIAAGRVLP